MTTRSGPDLDALTAVGVGKRYGRIWALRDCTLAVPAGSVVAVVGANGAGKTTLLKLVSGAVRPTTGSVAVGSGAAVSRVVHVAQDKPLYPGFTVAETMRFGERLNVVWDHEAAASWLRAFDVPMDRRCGQLSGGQRAQVALALAVGARPDVLLLDEPLSNLDPLVRKEVVRRLLDLVADTGLTILLSTHVVAELHGVADRLLVLARGRLVLEGDVDDLLREHRYVTGPDGPLPAPWHAVVTTRSGHQTSGLARRMPDSGPVPYATLPQWTFRPVALEDLILGYLAVHAAPSSNEEVRADA